MSNLELQAAHLDLDGKAIDLDRDFSCACAFALRERVAQAVTVNRSQAATGELAGGGSAQVPNEPDQPRVPCGTGFGTGGPAGLGFWNLYAMFRRPKDDANRIALASPIPE